MNIQLYGTLNKQCWWDAVCKFVVNLQYKMHIAISSICNVNSCFYEEKKPHYYVYNKQAWIFPSTKMAKGRLQLAGLLSCAW